MIHREININILPLLLLGIIIYAVVVLCKESKKKIKKQGTKIENKKPVGFMTSKDIGDRKKMPDGVIIAICTGAAIFIVKILEPILTFLKDFIFNRNNCKDDSNEPMTKGEARVMKLEILKEVDCTKASKEELNEVRGKLNSIYETVNLINTNVAVLVEQNKNLKEDISVLFGKLGG